ncbi:hemagglutinin repeat-containing protein [Ralstonia pseudosolanacearum]
MEGQGGFGVSASASKAKGNADGTGATQVNSHVNGSESVSIASGNDTNVQGGVVSGGRVIADVDGNLNLASRQDTSETRAKQDSMGGGSASFSASRRRADGTLSDTSRSSWHVQPNAGICRRSHRRRGARRWIFRARIGVEEMTNRLDALLQERTWRGVISRTICTALTVCGIVWLPEIVILGEATLFDRVFVPDMQKMYFLRVMAGVFVVAIVVREALVIHQLVGRRPK